MLQFAVMRFRFLTILLLFTSLLYVAPDSHRLDWSNSPRMPEIGAVDARAAVLLDVETNTVLYAHNRDEIIPPASIIKLVSMYVLLEAVEQGMFELHQDVPIPTQAWAVNAPPRSSLMFLGPGQRASLHELLLGLAIPSGNDASVAAALLMDDSMDAFVARLNSTLQEMGLRNTVVVEPSGYSRDNATTADELARFSRQYLLRFPEAVERYHSVRSFAYPQAGNVLVGNSEQAIIQQNYNRLLWLMPDADGLKTGTIPSVGYNLAATATRNGRRLLAIVLGVEGENSWHGNQRRAEVARDLLEYGFREYTAVHPQLPEAGVVRSYGTTQREIPLFIDAPWADSGSQPLMLPAGLPGRIQARLEVTRRMSGPLPAEYQVGRLVFYDGEQELFSAPVRTTAGAEQGAWWRRALDWLLLLWERIQGQEFPGTAAAGA